METRTSIEWDIATPPGTVRAAWRCISCGTMYAPHVDVCARCSPAEPFVPATPPWPWGPPLPYVPPVIPGICADRVTLNPQRCAFDGLPDGVYGLVCFCPKCSLWCGASGSVICDTTSSTVH